MLKIVRNLSLLLGLMLFAASAVSAEVVVQVMTVQDEAAARQEADRLFDLGIPAFSRTQEIDDQGVKSLVFVGPFETEKDATVAADTLKAQGVIKEYQVKNIEVADSDGLTRDAANSALGDENIPQITDPQAPQIGRTEPQLPVAQTPTYGEPVSPEQAQELGLSNSRPNNVQASQPAPRANEDYQLSTYGENAASGRDLPAYGQSSAPSSNQETDNFGVGDDLPGIALPANPQNTPGLSNNVPAGPSSKSSSVSLNEMLTLAPSAGDNDAPLMVAQYGAPPRTSYATGPMNIAGFSMLVDLSSSMRRLVPCNQRVKEEAVASLLRKMNHRIPSHPYTAALRVFGHKIAHTRSDFTTLYFGPETYNRDKMEDAIAMLAAADSVSPFATAIDAADNELMTMGNPKAILMFSDFETSLGSGNPVASTKSLRRRYNNNVNVYTFYATRQLDASQLAKKIAEAGGGKAYDICKMLDDNAAFEAMMMDIFGPSDAVPCQDSDGDGVCDEDDLCPNTPEGAPVDERGCWIAAYSQFFDFDKDVIKPAYLPRLKHAAEIMVRHPEITKVTIAGHTDSIGSVEYNKDLGRRRAESVRNFLVREGVSASRLHVVTYGASNPVASNDTEEGRARNRRVEFHIGEVPAHYKQ